MPIGRVYKLKDATSFNVRLPYFYNLPSYYKDYVIVCIIICSRFYGNIIRKLYTL